MEVIIRPTTAEAVNLTAKLIADAIRRKPFFKLGLATGATMEAVYADLAAMNKAGEVDFSRVVTFNLDEYIGLPPEDPNSYRYYMNKHLFSKINIDLRNTNLPNGLAEDEIEEGLRYEAAIEDAGGSVYTYNEGLCAENIFPCGTFEGDARPVLPGWTADENVFFTGEGIVFASDTAAKAVSIPVAVNGNAVQVAAEAEGEPEILLETENGTLLSPVNGVFFLPGGTQSVRVVLLACTGRVSSVTVRSHTCAFGSGENGVYTCSVCGAQISAAKDEPPASDGGGCASFAGTGACAVVAAAASAAAVLLMGRKKK